MYFYGFITANRFEITKKEDFKKAFDVFLESPYLKPFSESIARTKGDNKKEIRTMIKSLWEAFKKIDLEKLTSFTKIWELLSENTEFGLGLLEQVLKKFFVSYNFISILEEKIVEYGMNAIKMEHHKAMQKLSLEPHKLYPFYEYLIECQYGNTAVNPTRLQLVNYLQYVKEFINRFAIPNLYTENKNQANALIENITAALSRLTKLNTLFEQKLVSLLNLEGRTRSQEFKKVKEELLDLLNEYHNSDGTLKRNSIFINIENSLNYWQRNLPIIYSRKTDIDSIKHFVSTGNQEQYIFRNITTGEYQELIKIEQFSQSNKSLEREKWFYKLGANPGEGVNHPIKCTILLVSGALDLLNQLAKQDGQFAAVVIKDNEPLCFGIHEDALPTFNALVQKVVFTNKDGKKLAEIKFDKNKSLLNLVDLENFSIEIFNNENLGKRLFSNILN